MPNQSLPDFPPVCRDCGTPLDVRSKADGKGSQYFIVTCWNSQCLLKTFTRSLASYVTLSEQDLEAFRAVNRLRAEVN